MQLSTLLLNSRKSTVILRHLILGSLVFASFAEAQSSVPSTASVASSIPVKNFDEVVDRAIARERTLVPMLMDKEPVIETYIQEMKSDSDLGPVPEHDFYYLGRLDMSQGTIRSSFIRNGSVKNVPHLFRSLFSTENFGRGFTNLMFLDPKDFDRAHYKFTYVRRESLGDVHCILIEIVPVKDSAGGRFEGRVWVEDRDYTIVRLNGKYTPAPNHFFAHFDSWRVNTGPGLWLPAYIYAEDEASHFGPVHNHPMRAQTRLWDYEPGKAMAEDAFKKLAIEGPPHSHRKDKKTAAEKLPIQEQRLRDSQAENDVLHRLQDAGLVAPPGEVDQVLDTVLSNLEVSNKINNLDPPIRVRILLTTPLESVAINDSILISRGLIDVLPDEACLAAVLAHELSHILLGHSVNTKYTFADRLVFDDRPTFKKIPADKILEEEQSADAKAIEILKNSPYKDQLPRVGLFLRMLSARSDEVPHLIRPLLGNRMVDTHKDLRLSGLMEMSPQLQISNPEQIAALPLGSRVKMDPWSDQLHLLKPHTTTAALGEGKAAL